jgi:hypothetical protein
MNKAITKLTTLRTYALIFLKSWSIILFLDLN